VRNDTGLRLLKHTEDLADRLIVTYQLENEYKRNRQAAIFEGMQELKAPQQIPRPGIFSDAAAAKMMAKNVKAAETRVKKLRDRMVKALRDPATHDPVYQSCHRLFQKEDSLTLTRVNPLRHIIRRKAFRRFLHGCPPRKRSDISIGDAFNWEWMVHCATERKTGLVIVTRDSDYGITLEKESYVNDALRQEFSERVSRKRPLRLCSRLSDALKLFDVQVTAQEEATESQLVSSWLELPQTKNMFVPYPNRNASFVSKVMVPGHPTNLVASYTPSRYPYTVAEYPMTQAAYNALIGGPPPSYILVDEPGIPPISNAPQPAKPDVAESDTKGTAKKK
jgi:hypothetical protein